MSTDNKPDSELERRISSRALDVLIRAGLILVMAVLCYRIFSPFLTLMVWGVILAVTLYPLHQAMAHRMKGRQGLAATVLVLLGIVLIVGPTAVLMSSFGDSMLRLVDDVQTLSVKIPEPMASVAEWPLVGQQIHSVWSQAYADLPAFVASLRPKLGEVVKVMLGVVASIGGGLLLFLASFIIAGIIMAFGRSGAESSRAIFQRIVGMEHGAQFARLSTATIRAVAQGVLGVALIQAILVGLCLMIAHVPWAAVLAVIVLVLGIAQVPAAIVTLPAVAYIWMSGGYGNGEAILYTVLLIVAGLADNVLKPLMLGRGVEAPMPVILFGALGGMASAGILGMFVGAVLLALGYQIFMDWVAANPDRSGDAGAAHSAS